MGLAPFFERARQSAAQVLQGCDAGAFERRLGDVIVTLAFDTLAATSLEGLAALDMAARLIARLYPRVRILALDGDGALADELSDLVRSINPDVELVSEVSCEEITIVAGATALASDRTIYMGSDCWVARVSAQRPMGCGSGAVPFGAGAAACIAAANVFRVVFGAWLTRAEPDETVELSLLDFATGHEAGNADLPVGVDVGLVQLVGVGAIGNAFVWSLARLRGVAGLLHLIDHERVELSNLQRYVLAAMEDDGAVKVDLAASALADGDIRAAGFATTWAGYLERVGTHRFDLVVVALDTARDRVQVQGSLPRRIVNAWTQAGDLGVSRHGFGGEDACLACLYLPSGGRRNEDEIVAEELGFPPEELMNVRAMLALGTPVDEPLVRIIAGRRGLSVDDLLPFVGLPLRAFRQKAVCGNAIIRAKDGGGADVEVPMAFQSALAGVMLAAEVVATASGVRRERPAVRAVVDLMRRMPGRISFPMRRAVSEAAKCICADADYLEAYRAKYDGG